MWVPLSKPRRRRDKSVAGVVDDEPNELQVCVDSPLEKEVPLVLVGPRGRGWRQPKCTRGRDHTERPGRPHLPWCPLRLPSPAPQVHLRLQWRTDVVRGKSTKVEVNLAGLSLVVMGGLQVRVVAHEGQDKLHCSTLRVKLP